ncbi:hypothetical protein WMY93_024757 [Mugilogobius chulae]|uniref:C2H2-type domain-containing protein n=1 Tax=Mugilogobius chulae TaxID=88201 RepID=A0AAW0NBI4_9GOBI
MMLCDSFSDNDNENKTQYECLACGEVFRRSAELQKHMETHVASAVLSATKTSLKTKISRYQGRKREYADAHLAVHTGDTSFSCSESEAPFTLQEHRDRHMKVQSSLNCNMCSKKFNWKRDLLAHMSKHTGKKPFICPVCCEVQIQRQSEVKHDQAHVSRAVHLCRLRQGLFDKENPRSTHDCAHRTRAYYILRK